MDLQPLNGLNWDEIRVGDEETFENVEMPITRADHNQLPVSQKIKSMKLRSAKTSILHQNSCLMNRLEVLRPSSPESAKGKYESNTSSAFKT